MWSAVCRSWYQFRFILARSVLLRSTFIFLLASYMLMPFRPKYCICFCVCVCVCRCMSFYGYKLLTLNKLVFFIPCIFSPYVSHANYYFTDVYFSLPSCCCNVANFPTVGLIKDYFILSYIIIGKTFWLIITIPKGLLGVVPCFLKIKLVLGLSLGCLGLRFMSFSVLPTLERQ